MSLAVSSKLRSKSGKTGRKPKTIFNPKAAGSAGDGENSPVPALSAESKRRRMDTAEYIKKRFLYDVEDEPKRLKNRKTRPPRLTSAIVSVPRKPRLQVKHSLRSGAPSEDGMLPLRSRRGRRVKPKQDYSPLSHESKKSPPYFPENDIPLRNSVKRKGRRVQRSEILPGPELHQRRSTWELPDLFNADDNDQLDELSQSESGMNDARKQRVSWRCSRIGVHIRFIIVLSCDLTQLLISYSLS